VKIATSNSPEVTNLPRSHNIRGAGVKPFCNDRSDFSRSFFGLTVGRNICGGWPRTPMRRGYDGAPAELPCCRLGEQSSVANLRTEASLIHRIME
jgi:hypothetical protein